MRRRTGLPLALLTTAAATTAYAGLIERTRWTLRRYDVPILAPGSAPLRVLHLSDMHMTAGQSGKQEWIRALDALEPDLVLSTGDHIAGQTAVPGALTALGPMLGRPGAFVFGSNDYFAPRPKNPLKYLFPDDKRRRPGDPLPWRDLRDAMLAAGWQDLSNTRATVTAAGRTVALAGVDDPHIRRDRYDQIAGRALPSADLRIGLSHSPEPRVLDGFAADGYELIVCGHTHGGQLRVPIYGALVTNCGLDRGRCRGLSRWHDSWLNVSAGLGTSPYAPVRFACPPEATLLTLVPRSAGPEGVG